MTNTSISFPQILYRMNIIEKCIDNRNDMENKKNME
jgi:hypothetical protein